MANFRTHVESKTGMHAESKVAERCWSETFRVLDRTFDSSHLPEYLKKLKSKAYSNVYLEIGKEHYSNGRMTDARKALLRAVAYDPLQLVRSNLLFFLLMSLLGARFGMTLITLRKRQLSMMRTRK
jgi:hypothetical protein